MCTELRIVVAGHSFVGHVKNFIDNDNDMLNRYQYSFNLYKENAETQFVFRSGCDVLFMQNVLKTVIEKKLPHIIILEIGSNDLTKTYIQPARLADKVIKLSQSLMKSTTKFIIISAVIHRKITRTSMSPDEYNNRVNEYNEIMSKAVQKIPTLIFWHHPRINRGNNLLKPDGVHLNNAGNYHLYMSYKNSLAHAIWHINARVGCNCDTATLAKQRRVNVR